MVISGHEECFYWVCQMSGDSNMCPGVQHTSLHLGGTETPWTPMSSFLASCASWSKVLTPLLTSRSRSSGLPCFCCFPKVILGITVSSPKVLKIWERQPTTAVLLEMSLARVQHGVQGWSDGFWEGARSLARSHHHCQSSLHSSPVLSAERPGCFAVGELPKRSRQCAGSKVIWVRWLWSEAESDLKCGSEVPMVEETLGTSTSSPCLLRGSLESLIAPAGMGLF